MCETENLIISIEKHPCLWDINNKDFHNKDVRDLAWEKVCNEVISNWDTCTDKVNKGAVLRKRWTHIRDYYRKDLQKSRSGSANRRHRKYVYANMLYFLAPLFEKRSADSKCKVEIIKEKDIKQEDIKQPSPPPSPSPSPSPPPILVKQKKQHSPKEDAPDHLLNISQQRDETNPDKNEDDDIKFLLSFRTYMRQMNMHQKIEFQMGMLQLVKKITADSGYRLR